MKGSEAIYVTLGGNQLKEKPYREQIKNFLKCNGTDFFFVWSMNLKPTKEFVWVYIVIGNKVRWRARFIGWDDRNDILVNNGEKQLKSKHFAQLIDFEKLPAPYQEMKGFQGFRYKT